MTDRRGPRVRRWLGAATLALAAATWLATPGTSSGAARADYAPAAGQVHGLPQLPSGVAAADATVPGRLLLMLDASGSMNEKDPSGMTKIAAAKKALTAVVGGLPSDAQVGLRVYGATQTGGKPTPAACADTQLVHPISILDKPGLTAAINGFKAKGETPIAHSLQAALKDLGGSGKRNIVLVSDGQESCVPDPCPVIKKVVGTGVDLQIDTVGFAVNAKARQQLQCIADAGHGSYYDAKDATGLVSSLTKLSQRALRSFTVSGTPISTSPDAAQAPTVGPGQYTDSFAGKAPARYVRLTRTPGSTVHVSISARAPAQPSATDTERWTLRATTPDGAACDTASEGAIQFYREGVTVAAVTVNRSGTPTSATDKACADSPVLLLSVERPAGADVAQPAELLYIEEPPVTNTSALPAAAGDADLGSLQAARVGSGSPVSGGSSFSDAVTLTPGTYQDTLIGDEQVFYRVRLGFGQRAAFTADVPAPGTDGTQPTSSSVLFQVDDWSPARDKLTRVLGRLVPDNRLQLTGHTSSIVVGEYTAPVRYANRSALTTGKDVYRALSTRSTTMAGYYYFSIARDSSLQAAGLRGEPVPIRFAVAVDGAVSGTPTYATGAATASTSSTSSTSPAAGTTTTSTKDPVAKDTASHTGLLVGLGAALVAAVAGAAVVLARRRGSPAHS